MNESQEQAGPSFPVTPSGKSHEEIDQIVRKLAAKHSISLPVRHHQWSPSKSRTNTPESCYSYVKYLFFADRTAIYRAISEFEDCVGIEDDQEQRLKKLLNCLNTEKWIIQNTIRPAFNWKNRSAQSRAKHPALDEAKVQSPSSVVSVNQIHSHNIFNGNGAEAPMADVADEDFTTPPQSPSPDTHTAEPLSRQKRRTEDMLKDELSPKQRKIPGLSSRISLHRIDSAATFRNEKSIWNTIRGPVKSENTSFASTTDMSCTSSIKQQDKSSTACTSFSTDVNDVDQRKVLETNFASSDNFSVDDETVHQHVRDYDQTKTQVSKLDLNLTETLGKPSHLHVARMPLAKQEQHQVRDLPHGGLFVQSSSTKPNVSFSVWYECARVAIFNNLRCEELIPQLSSRNISYSTLWDNLQEPTNQHLQLPQPCSAAAWKAAQEGFNNISLRAKVNFSTTNSGPLFKFCPEPMQIETSCRFQRKFGGDRFLFLEFPIFGEGSFPQHLKGQCENLKARFSQWLKVEKYFLGRKWSIFHYSTKSKRSALKKTQAKLQRVILFATEGHDIPSISIDELINWFICLKSKRVNRALPYCKAYSRLDLGLSRTAPTIIFRPSQIRRINDNLADGSSEKTEFDDQDLEWPELHDARRPNVMNDGCARISVGAAVAIWAKLNKSGPVPSIFQARIGGCKGLWICSASTSNNDPMHQDFWIEIAPSQRKFEPHEEDERDSTFDPERLTFEVVDHSRPLSRDKLHVDFLPILEDRGVPFTNLAKLAQTALDQEKLQLFEALDNPVNFRKWINQHFQLADVAKKRGDYSWNAGMPSFLGDKINYLLEAGFDPKCLRFLADLTHQFVKSNYSTEMRYRFHIPMVRTTSVMGIADPLGVLEPGQIHLAFSRGFYDEVSGESYPCLDRREVLVARHPTLRCSDIQKVRAVYKSELGHLSDVVIFPSKGSYPLAAKLQGGDYDGDTFWMCWEPQVTSNFRNAPPPVDVATPQALGIDVDTRSVRDLTDGQSVEPFLSAGLEFKLNPDFLGIATVLHGKAAYYENSINTPAVRLLADLHDYLVDSAKNGFLFGPEDYSRFVSKLPGIPLKALKEPTYKIAMAFSARDDQSLNPSENQITRYNKNHINDWIYFEVMSPHIKKVLESLLEIRDRCSTLDSGLTIPFDKAVDRAEDMIVRAELEHLSKALEALYKRAWAQQVNRNFGECLDNCFQEYQEINPLNSNHAVMRCWMQKDLIGIPSQWELIKASCLFKIFHAKIKFCFGMAGKHLAFIKASSSQSVHLMVSSMWANTKARRAIEVAAGEGTDLARDHVDPGPAVPLEDSDSELGDFMTAPDVDAYSDVDRY